MDAQKKISRDVMWKLGLGLAVFWLCPRAAQSVPLCSPAHSSDIEIHGRILSRADAVTPKITPWTLTGAPKIDEQDLLAATDLNGDGKTDLVLIHKGEALAGLASLEEHTFRFQYWTRLESSVRPVQIAAVGEAVRGCGMAVVGATGNEFLLLDPAADQPLSKVSLDFSADAGPVQLVSDRWARGPVMFQTAESGTKFSVYEGGEQTRLRATGPWSPDYVFSGFGDSRLGHSAFFMYEAVPGVALSFFFGNTVIEQASLARNLTAARIVDINGDGASELLVEQGEQLEPALSKLWRVGRYSRMMFAMFDRFESFPGLIPEISRNISLRDALVGDFDGDGASDVFLREGDENSVLTFEPVKAECLDLEVRGGGQRALPAADGRFVLRLPASGGEIKATSANCSFQPDSLAIGPEDGARQSVALFGHLPSSDGAGAPYPRQPQAPGPFVCTGFQIPVVPGEGSWGRRTVCAPGFAMVETAIGKHYNGTCCRLPEGILNDGEGSWRYGIDCPPGNVVTALATFPEHIESVRRDLHVALPPPKAGSGPLLRCTPVRSPFAVGEALSGQYWGDGNSMVWNGSLSGTLHPPRSAEEGGVFSRFASFLRVLFDWNVNPLSWAELPAGIRTAFGRASFVDWSTDGCTGQPPGSLLTGVHGERCDAVYFAPLVRGIKNHGETFRRCRNAPNAFDPFAGCAQ